MKKCHLPFLPSGFLFARRILKARALVLAIGMVAVISPSNLAADSPTTVFFDDVEFREISPGLGSNLAPNASFLNGTGDLPNDWIQNPNGTDATFLWNTSFGRTDNFSVKISASQRFVILANPGWRTSDFIQIDPSKEYRASVWTFTPDERGVGHIPAVQFFEADGKFLGTIGATGPSGLDDPVGVWVEKFFTFTPANIPSLVSATKVKLIVVQEIPDPELEVLYGVNASDDGLSVIDPTTGVVTFLGSLDPDPNLLVTPVAMAVRPFDGKIFVWNNSDKDPTNGIISNHVLLTVDRCTGLATRVGLDTGFVMGALAFDPTNGTLFGFTSSALFEIDPDTGAATQIVTVDKNIFGADFDASGTLFAITPPTLELVTIDTVTGADTTIAILSSTLGVPGSIVFDPATGTLIGSAFGGSSGNILFDINTSTGAVTNSRPLVGGFAPQGLGFAPACQLEEESVTKTFSPTETRQTYSFDGGNNTLTVDFVDGVVQPFDLTLTAVDTPPGQVASRLDPNVFPPGTKCFPYATTGELCVVYRAEEPLPSPDLPDPDFTGSFDIRIKYFNPVPAPANPRMAHDRSDIEGDKFTEDMTTGFDPLPNPGDPGDPALSGRTTRWSHIVAVDLAIQIDIKPGSFPNSIKLSGNGAIPVAILSTNTFDALTVDPSTVELNSAGVRLRGKGLQAHAEDVNGDGIPDLVVQIDRGTFISLGDGIGVLAGFTFSGSPVSGTDSVRIIE